MAIYKSSHTGIEIDSLIDNIAPAYSTDYPYKTGDLTTYQGVLYECQEATYGAWNVRSWKEIKVSELLKYVSPDMVKTINNIKPDASGNVNIELADIPGDDDHASVSEAEKKDWNNKATKDYADKHGPAPTKTQITTALGYTPYDASNPNGYTNNKGTVTSITAGTGLLVGDGKTTSSITTSGTLNINTDTIATKDFVGNSISNIKQVPTNGTNGQVLTKTSSGSDGYGWQNINTVPTGGNPNQVLTKTSSGYGWADIKSSGGFVIQTSSPTDTSLLWINSTNRTLNYYDSTTRKWKPIAGTFST